jgi:hypothetical protein
MFCALKLIFGGNEGVWSRFHVLRSINRFGRYRGRRVPLSYLALPDSFSAIPRAPCFVFMFCAPGPILSGSEGVISRFYVLRSRTRFYVLCSKPVRAELRAPSPIFMFDATGPVSGGIEGAESNFHVSRSPPHFPQYLGRRVPFSCFSLPDTFSAVQGRRVPFSCFALPNTFWAVSRVSGPVLMFSAPELIFNGTEGASCRFHVLRSRTRFRLYQDRSMPLSSFVLPDPFLDVPRTSNPVFMFCAPGQVFDGTEGVGSHFRVLRSWTHFHRD